MLGLFGSRGFIDPRLRLIATARGRSVVTAGNLLLGQTRCSCFGGLCAQTAKRGICVRYGKAALDA